MTARRGCRGRPRKTPRAVRHALVYLFGNARKHGEPVGALDPLSSAPYFRGFREFPRFAPFDTDPKLAPRFARGDPPHAPRTWLLHSGLLRCEFRSDGEARLPRAKRRTVLPTDEPPAQRARPRVRTHSRK